MNAETDDGRDRSKADTTDETADDTADIKADEGAAKRKVTCHPYICPVNKEHASLRSSKTVGFKSMQTLISHLKRIHDAYSASAKEETHRQHLKLHPPEKAEPYRPERKPEVESRRDARRREDRGAGKAEKLPEGTLPLPPKKVLKFPPIEKYTHITWGPENIRTLRMYLDRGYTPEEVAETFLQEECKTSYCDTGSPYGARSFNTVGVLILLRWRSSR